LLDIGNPKKYTFPPTAQTSDLRFTGIVRETKLPVWMTPEVLLYENLMKLLVFRLTSSHSNMKT
jgi:hypothetical protein